MAMDAIDGWAFGNVTGIVMRDADRTSSIIDRVALVTDDDGGVQPDQLLIEVAGRTYTLTMVRNDEEIQEKARIFHD